MLREVVLFAPLSSALVTTNIFSIRVSECRLVVIKVGGNDVTSLDTNLFGSDKTRGQVGGYELTIESLAEIAH